MKKAIVLGATGGVGNPVTAELLKRNIETVVFGRSMNKLRAMAEQLGNPSHLKLAEGDVFSPDDIVRAAEGADTIINSANVAYHKMAEKLPPLGESVLEAAKRLQVKTVLVDGIYPYGRKTSQDPITEDHPKKPHTRKGQARHAYEQLFMRDGWGGKNTLIARLPDYYGPSAKQSYLNATMEAIAAGKNGVFIGTMKVPREYVYLPDAARMIVELASRDDTYGENWHIPGPGVISGEQIVAIASRAAGYKGKIRPVGKITLSLLGLFEKPMKEIVEMLYLTEEPLTLSGEKYRRRIGEIPSTPYEKGIADTIRQLQAKIKSNM
ncbi:SDR family NAD(P)-dependent oxidoreductase [Paenibacillus oralis]|uniref:SDR family NAD(P)-dependent oxidoreductase n=1 Tax=Paenibacillus oralis TaxID=2490856 RepID=A0A3P3TVH4_9BACL|nr:SDR family NAD(P)-dependent oxidoreductase [Paenibacillus oralis]RRJ62082.1 SDR family NAD(P)-dependent oxidoreductase [Paenibacillus oralis]